MTHTPPSLPPGLRLLPWSAALIWLALLFAGVAWCWSELGWDYSVANSLYSKEKPELRGLDYELLTPEEGEVRSQDSAVHIPFVARFQTALVLISALCGVAGAILGIVAGRRMRGHCYAPGTAALAVACTFSLGTFLIFGALGFGVAVALLRAERGQGVGVVVLRMAGSLLLAVMGLVYARHWYALYRTPREDEPAFALPRPGAFALIFLVAGSVLTMAGLGVHFRSERKAEKQAASIAKDLRKKERKASRNSSNLVSDAVSSARPKFTPLEVGEVDMFSIPHELVVTWIKLRGDVGKLDLHNAEAVQQYNTRVAAFRAAVRAAEAASAKK